MLKARMLDRNNTLNFNLGDCIMRTIHSEKGFTLLEISIVVVIVGVMAVIATPMLLTRIHRSGVESAASQIAAHLTQIRQEAIRSRAFYRLNLTDYENGYTIETCDQGCLNVNGQPVEIRWESWKGRMMTEEGYQTGENPIILPENVELVPQFERADATIVETENYIIFDPKGIVELNVLKGGFPANIVLASTQRNYYKILQVSIAGFVRAEDTIINK